MAKDNYTYLTNVLDALCLQAPRELKIYHPDSADIEGINQARSRAYIHLYLMSHFGLVHFADRESLVTDGTMDGGIDGYYIDRERRVINFIQSKFRTNRDNFEAREIRFEEILAMDVNRVLTGDLSAENGTAYSGKIRDMVRQIQAIDDIGRYNNQVILLANIKPVSRDKLMRLTGGFNVEVVDHGLSYSDLLFPVLTGTFYDSENLYIQLNLSNKQSGAKIDYGVTTKVGPVQITVVFVPTLEIARMMQKYRNSILKFNPRCFLDLAESAINVDIAESITARQTNEFALFNNGITMLSDDTVINEKIGYKDRAQLAIRNPQILNGGQSAFALFRILQDYGLESEKLFTDKEVLLKIITMNRDKISASDRLALIEEISSATNKQNAVTYADRRSNDLVQLDIQKQFFAEHGVLYERKRGEFADAVNQQYIGPGDVLPRPELLRISRAIAGDLTKKQSGRKYFYTSEYYDRHFRVEDVPDYYLGFIILRELQEIRSNPKESSLSSREALRHGPYLLLFVFHRYVKVAHIQEAEVAATVHSCLSRWIEFCNYAIEQEHNRQFYYDKTDKVTGQVRQVFSYPNYYKSEIVVSDLLTAFRN
jgi:hypothetical protein